MKEFYNNNKTIIDKIIVVLTVILIMYLFFDKVFPYVVPFVFGLLLSLILTPIAKMITKYLHISKGISSLLSIILILILIGVFFNLGISRILKEGQSFLANIPENIVYVQNTIQDLNSHYNYLYELIPDEWSIYLTQFVNDITLSLTSFVGVVLKDGSTAFVSKVPNFLLSFVLGLVSCFFFIKDRELIVSSISNITPKFIKKYFLILKNGIIDAILGYIRAQLMLMAIVAVICFTGLAILDVEYALFLCLIIAIVDALPVFGSGFFFWPWSAFSLITGNYKMAIGLILTYLCVLFTRQILEPKILGTQIGIHPLLTLISIYVGLRVFGVFGIFIGPCIIVIIKTIAITPITIDNEALSS